MPLLTPAQLDDLVTGLLADGYAILPTFGASDAVADTIQEHLDAIKHTKFGKSHVLGTATRWGPTNEDFLAENVRVAKIADQLMSDHRMKAYLYRRFPWFKAYCKHGGVSNDGCNFKAFDPNYQAPTNPHRLSELHTDLAPAHDPQNRAATGAELYTPYRRRVAGLVQFMVCYDNRRGFKVRRGGHEVPLVIPADQLKAAKQNHFVFRRLGLSDADNVEVVAPIVPPGGLLLWFSFTPHAGIPTAQRRTRYVTQTYVKADQHWAQALRTIIIFVLARLTTHLLALRPLSQQTYGNAELTAQNAAFKAERAQHRAADMTERLCFIRDHPDLCARLFGVQPARLFRAVREALAKLKPEELLDVTVPPEFSGSRWASDSAAKRPKV